jgi:hemerythrin-like domain-containing protein
MDVTRMLEADHSEAEQLIGRIERADGVERQPLVEELATALRAHMELEEAVLYPAMIPVTGREEAEEGTNEHGVIRSALEQVVALSSDEPGFGAALDALRAGIEHHVHDEEHDVFPELRKDGADVLAGMATPFMGRRLQLGLPMEADALSRASSKDELVDEARAVGVDGADSMSKADLASALADHMSGSGS